MELPKSTEPVMIKVDRSFVFKIEPAVEVPFFTFIFDHLLICNNSCNHNLHCLRLPLP